MFRDGVKTWRSVVGTILLALGGTNLLTSNFSSEDPASFLGQIMGVSLFFILGLYLVLKKSKQK